MCKKAYAVLAFLFLAYSLSAQYEDDAPVGNSRKDTTVNKKLFEPFRSDKIIFGTEAMLTLNTGTFFAELSPFAAYPVFRPLQVGAGIHGSFLSFSSGTNTVTGTYFGAHAFTRLVVGQSFFLHAEMRALNGIVDFSTKDRKWVASPIYGVGLSYGAGLNSWVLLGYAPNSDFANINPFEHLVYRIGFRF
jgi:hypothetical protein